MHSRACAVKAKFHCASWFKAGSKLVANRFQAKFHYAIWFEPASNQLRTTSVIKFGFKALCGTQHTARSNRRYHCVPPGVTGYAGGKISACCLAAAALTGPRAAVEFDAHAGRLGMNAVRHEANASCDDWRINLTQLGDVRVYIALEHLQTT